MQRAVAVIGGGSWGTAVAATLARRNATRLWVRRCELAAVMTSTRQNTAYLPGVSLPEQLIVTGCSNEALSGAAIVVMAVPSHGFREVLRTIGGAVPAGALIVSLTKGLEQVTLFRMSEIIQQELPGHATAVLTGPNLVHEIIQGLPAASVVASENHEVATTVQTLFASEALRVYTNSDVVGCELAGALKNVVAIGVGIVDGMQLGVNASAALLTRGLAELTRLGVALGGHAATFAGLAGVGDLVATCSSPYSRNRRFGTQLATGLCPAEIEATSATIAEGVRSCAAVVALAVRAGVETPIASAVDDVLSSRSTATQVTQRLLARIQREEFWG